MKATKLASRGANAPAQVAQQIIAQAGGEISSTELEQAMMARGIGLKTPNGDSRTLAVLQRLRSQGIVKYKAPRGISVVPYQIKLTNKAILAAPAPERHMPARKVAAVPHQPLEILAKPVKPEAPDGVAVHLQGGIVNVWVDGERTKFSRKHFAMLTDLFAIMNGKP